MFACDNVSQPSIDGLRKLYNEGVAIEDIFANIDEERRLHYVGNTRAKKNLFVITYEQPSMFILEALGVITGNCNQHILDAVVNEEVLIIYENAVNELLLSPNSKYYYDSTKYTVQ